MSINFYVDIHFSPKVRFKIPIHSSSLPPTIKCHMSTIYLCNKTSPRLFTGFFVCHVYLFSCIDHVLGNWVRIQLHTMPFCFSKLQQLAANADDLMENIRVKPQNVIWLPMKNFRALYVEGHELKKKTVATKISGQG